MLAPEERAEVEQRLSRIMDQSGAEIAVFVPGSLEGETIEDVAYKTFNTWRIGRDKLDNGVLLVVAPKEHRIRVETGKGIGGRLTDLQASDIIEHRIAPRLREGRYRAAIDDGVDDIAGAIGGTTPAPRVQSPPPMLVGIGVILFVVVLFILRTRLGRGFFFWGGPGGGGGWRGGGGGRWGGGGSGGGGYSGGGGRSGGGGASGGW